MVPHLLLFSDEQRAWSTYSYRAGGSIVTMQSAPLWPDTTICPSGAPIEIGAVVAPPGTRTVTLMDSCCAVEPTVCGVSSVTLPALSRRMMRHGEAPPAAATELV